jgi:hypothetical protein
MKRGSCSAADAPACAPVDAVHFGLASDELVVGNNGGAHAGSQAIKGDFHANGGVCAACCELLLQRTGCKRSQHGHPV